MTDADYGFVIPQPLVQAIINYLATRPWREANPLIDAITQLQPIDMPRTGPRPVDMVDAADGVSASG